jgi:hypothetical protein
MTKHKSAPQQSSSIRAFIDQVNEGMATLLLGEDESVKIVVPLAWLPAGAGEGTVLQLTASIETQMELREKAQTQRLMESLGDNP